MIVVKIELWPGGYEGNKIEIGRTTITNRGGSASDTRGDYDVAVMRRGTETTVQWTGEVLRHPRRSMSVWKLVQKALNSALGEVGSK